jgi:uncharacterized membrane protein YhhN
MLPKPRSESKKNHNMHQRSKRLFSLYWVIVLTDLLLILFQENELRWFTKPLLMPLLGLVIFSNRKLIKLAPLMIVALFFSWAGDLFLQMKGMFIPGLISFLLAHICYIIYFIRMEPSRKGLLQVRPLVGIPVAVYIVLFLFLLFPFLDKLRVPVTVYALTIGSMMLAAINTKGKLNAMAATLFFNGGLQFVISDSILAVNMFAYPSYVLSICVMATYASAQYLIVKGGMQYGLGAGN